MAIVDRVMEGMPPGTEAVIMRVSAHSSDKLGRSSDRAEVSLGHLACVRRLEQAGGAEAITAQDAAGQALRKRLGVIAVRRQDVDARADVPGRVMAHAWPLPQDGQLLLFIADSAAEDNIPIPGDLPRNAASELMVQLVSHGGIGQLRGGDWTRLVRDNAHGARVVQAARRGRCRVFAGTVEVDVFAPNGGFVASVHTGTSVSEWEGTVKRTKTGKLSLLLRDEPAWPYSARLVPVGMTCSADRQGDDRGRGRRARTLRPDLEAAPAWTAFYRAWAAGSTALECGRILADANVATRGQAGGGTFADLDDASLANAAYTLASEAHYRQLRDRRYRARVRVPVPVLDDRWEGYDVDFSYPAHPYGSVVVDIPIDHPIDLRPEDFAGWRARLDRRQSRARTSSATARALAGLPGWSDPDWQWKWRSVGTGPDGPHYYRLHRRRLEDSVDAAGADRGWLQGEGDRVVSCESGTLEAARGRAIQQAVEELGDAAVPAVVRPAPCGTAERDRARREQRHHDLARLVEDAREDLADAQDAYDRNGTTRRAERVEQCAAAARSLEDERERLATQLDAGSAPNGQSEVDVSTLAAIAGLLQGSGGRPMPAQLNRLVRDAIGESLRVTPRADDPRIGVLAATVTWPAAGGTDIRIDVSGEVAISTLDAKRAIALGESIARRVLAGGHRWHDAVAFAGSTGDNANAAAVRWLRAAGMPRYPRWRRSALLDCPVAETKAIAWAQLTGTELPPRTDERFADLVRDTYLADSDLSWGGAWANDVALSRMALQVFADMAGRGEDPGEGLRGADLAAQLGSTLRQAMNLAGPDESTDIRLRHVLESHPDDKRVVRPKSCGACGNWLLHVVLAPETAAHHGLVCAQCCALPDGTPLPSGYLALWEHGHDGTRLATAQEYLPARRPVPGQRTLLRIGPAARRIGITAKRLRALANSGQIPVHRRAKGRERLFDPADVDRMKARLDEQAE